MRPWQKRKQKEARNIQNTAIKNSKFLRVEKDRKSRHLNVMSNQCYVMKRCLRVGFVN